MIFDTDVLIWAQRGNLNAAHLINTTYSRAISILTYMELLQKANNKTQHLYTKNFLKDFGFTLLPLTESIGHRALVYIEEYSMANGLNAMDAMIAATAVERNIELATANLKHYKVIHDLKLHAFKP